MKIGKTIGTIFGIAIVCSFVFMGCKTGTGPTTNTGSKTIVIADFPGSANSGNHASISLHSTFAFNEITAMGAVPIRTNRLTVPLYIGADNETRWDGSDEYYVLLSILNDEWETEKVFIYSYEEPNSYLTNVPRYSFTERVSTIYFEEFYDITEWPGVGGNGAVPTPNTDPKTIVITGFPGSAYSGKFAGITLLSSFNPEEEIEITIIGIEEINGSTLAVPLYINDEDLETEWNGTGEYYVLLSILNDEGDIEEVFIYSDEEPNYYGTNVPKYPITERESTISFNEFLDITEWAEEYLLYERR